MMADTLKQDGSAAEAVKPEITKSAPKQNPVFRMMGLPNFRLRLPSRNWMIFWTITGSFTGAVIYDRRQKKAVQKKWCDLVAHIAQEPLPVNQTPRKLTVFLSAAPGDGIGPSRQYFKDYIKPILVAASMDYDVIEGRKQGDVRYGTAEQIRRLRRKQGEAGAISGEEEMDAAIAIETMRARNFITPEPGLKGDLVLGRHTWKEYIRGIHEGWLGPLNEPEVPETETLDAKTPEIIKDAAESESGAEPKQEESKPEEDKEKKKKFPPAAYLSTSDYSSAPLSPHIPSLLEPSNPLYQQHVLGFLKFPIRIFNFLNRRKLADELGRETAAIVLAAHRPYEYSETFASSTNSDIVATRAPESDEVEVVQTGSASEQQSLLQGEEQYWHKSIKKVNKDDTSERLWLDGMVLDPRIAQRMSRFRLDPEEEQRASRIFNGLEKGRAREIEDLTKEKVVIGNVDNEVD